jgi:transposase
MPTAVGGQSGEVLKRHLLNLLTYVPYWITNAAAKGLNSVIQALKGAARGFRNYRSRILFFREKIARDLGRLLNDMVLARR